MISARWLQPARSGRGKEQQLFVGHPRPGLEVLRLYDPARLCARAGRRRERGWAMSSGGCLPIAPPRKPRRGSAGSQGKRAGCAENGSPIALGARALLVSGIFLRQADDKMSTQSFEGRRRSSSMALPHRDSLSPPRKRLMKFSGALKHRDAHARSMAYRRSPGHSAERSFQILPRRTRSWIPGAAFAR